jgi:fumarylpyruvate hydrolase
VGRNYAEHAQEMGFTGREPPFFFLKPADAVVPVAEGQRGEIDYPSLTANLHHEIELVVAIGKGGSGIRAADAPDHVWGYAIGLDMTRRDLQNDMKKQGRPWYRQGLRAERTHRPHPSGGAHRRATQGSIELTVNGATRQKADLKDLIWNVAETIEHLSAAWTLQPGDLIYTGTPAGVATVVRGDLMEGRIAGLGALKVRVKG